MTLCVYSMWVSRVELEASTETNRQVVIPFSPDYKLAKGYTQHITVVERVPKIDGYTMPPPRTKKMLPSQTWSSMPCFNLCYIVLARRTPTPYPCSRIL